MRDRAERHDTAPQQGVTQEHAVSRLGVVAAALFGVVVMTCVTTQVIGAEWIGVAMSITALACGACLWLARAGEPEWAAMALIAPVCAVLFLIAGLGSGFKSSAVLSAPGLLVAASIVCRRDHFIAVFLLSLVCTGLIGASRMGAVEVLIPQSTVLNQVLAVAVVLTAFALVGWTLADGIQTSLDAAAKENASHRITQQRLYHLSTHDELTGLTSRTHTRALIENILGACAEERKQVAIMFLQINNLNTLRYSAGHTGGDEILKRLASRMLKAAKSAGVVGRHDGDKFLVAIPNVVDRAEVGATATRMLAEINAPMATGNTHFEPECSLGVALFPIDGHDFATLIDKADAAMRRAHVVGGKEMLMFSKHDADMRDMLRNPLDPII